MLTGLSVVHLELTSKCNKGCWMCGRRKIEKEYPELAVWGHMDFSIVSRVARQLPTGVVVQFHNNGEPLMYPKLKEALQLFTRQIRCFNTNGKLLLDKYRDICDNMDVLTISVIENDPEADAQYDIVKKFIEIKGDKKPRLVYRLLGEVKDKERWYKLPGIVVTRILHSPMGSFSYSKTPTIPEIGTCLEALTHVAINREGLVSLCVRFDPYQDGVVGDLKKETLDTIWNGKVRQRWIKYHVDGERNQIPFCSRCEFWGIPKGV